MELNRILLKHILQVQILLLTRDVAQKRKSRFVKMLFYGGAIGTLMSWGMDGKMWQKEFSLNGLPGQELSVFQQRLGMGAIGSLSGLAAVTSGAGSKGKEPFYPGGYQKQKAGVTGLKFFLNLLAP